MSRAAQMFRETDVTKAGAALKAGLAVQRFEIERGKITIVGSKQVTADIAEDARG